MKFKRLIKNINEWRFLKFILIGFSGIFVNQIFLWIFTTKLGFYYVVSSVLAIELAILNNFTWNSVWTFKNRIINPNFENNIVRFIKYNIVSWSLDFFNIVLLIFFTEIFKIYFLYSNLIAIVFVTLMKYSFNLRWVFPSEKMKEVEKLQNTKVSLVIPTYNERVNIESLLQRIVETFDKSKISYEIIVVDDASTDKTYDVVKQLSKRFSTIKLVVRNNKRGLSSAILHGFKHSTGDVLGVMDADLSHPPELLPIMSNKILRENVDIVIGSRYIKGGKSLMNKQRNFVSRVASLSVWPLTFTKDPLSGFFFLKKSVIKNLDLNSNGFKILLEILVKGNYRKVIEVPYTFNKRKYGKSKLSLGEIFRFLIDCSKLYLWRVIKI